MNRRSGLLLAFFVCILALATTVWSPSPAAAEAPTITVDSIGDEPDASIFDGVCATSLGTCTLRAAIDHANASYGPDEIHFAIPSADLGPIVPATPLPPIWGGEIVIDGYTQPGAAVNTAEAGSNAVIAIEIKATDHPWGIRLQSAGNTIRGLSIYDALIDVEFHTESADGNVIIGSFIGTNPAGTFAKAPADLVAGIVADHGPDRNRIGMPGAEHRNIVSGFGAKGIRLTGGSTSQNRVQNNVVGYSPDLSTSLGGWVGIDAQWWTWGNLIGGFGEGEGNLIGGLSTTAALDFSHGATNNAMVGNYVGTLADGDSIASHGSNRTGIVMKDGVHGNYVGFNVIGNSTDYGIRHYSRYTGDNVFDQNRIGVGVDGSNIGNGKHGIFQAGFDQFYYRNLIANNAQGGVLVTNALDGEQYMKTDDTTLRTQFREHTFYNNGHDLAIDLEPYGANDNDAGDADDGPNTLLNKPVVTGIGPGKVFGTACADCLVEVSISGEVLGDGSLGFGQSGAGIGLGWIGTVKADTTGAFSLAATEIVAGRTVTVLAIDGDGNSSETTLGDVVPTVHEGVDGTANDSLDPVDAPARPSAPPDYVGIERATLAGSVTDSAGAPASAALAVLFASDTDGVRGQWVTTVRVGDDGNYVVMPTPGCWVLTYIAPAGSTFAESNSRWLDVHRCVVADQVIDDLDVVLAPEADAEIGGEVLDAGGDAVVGASVQLFEANADGSRGAWRRSASTDTDGAYAFAVTSGCWTVTMIAPTGETFSANGSQWLSLHRCIDSGKTVDDVDGTLAAAADASIAGAMSKADDSAVAAASVQLFTATADGSRGSWVESTSTEADGSYSFAVTAGCWSLTFVAPEGTTFAQSGSRWLHEQVCVASAEAVTGVDAVLSPVADSSVGGSVLTDDGTGVAGASVQLFVGSADGSRVSWVRSGTTATDGTYSFSVTAGCWVVTFVAPAGEAFAVNGSGWLNQSGCVEAGESLTDLNAVLAGAAPASLAGSVVDDAGAGVSGISIDLFTATADSTRGAWQRATTTDANGNFGFDLDVGCWVLTYIAPEGDTFTGTGRYLHHSFCVADGDSVIAPAVTVS